MLKHAWSLVLALFAGGELAAAQPAGGLPAALAAADALYEAEDWTPARDAYAAALKLDPASAAAQVGLGRSLTRLRENARGIEVLEGALQAVERLPQGPDRARLGGQARQGLALLYVRQNRSAAAMQVLRQAIKDLGTLAPGGKPEDIATLADATDDLSTLLRDKGEHAAALEQSRAAEAIMRPVARKALRFTHWYAFILVNLSNRYSNLGRPDDALKVQIHALPIWRELAAKKPERYEEGLADALNSLLLRHSAMGRLDEAVAAGEESVAINRRLEKAQPGSRAHELASALTNLGDVYDDQSAHAKALAATEEAVAIFMALREKDPNNDGENLASALNNYGNILRRQGRVEDAIRALATCVKIRQALVPQGRLDLAPDLAGSLSNLGNALRMAGQAGQAAAMGEEAVKIFETLEASDPGRWRVNLSIAWDSLGDHYMASGRTKDAVRAYGKAVEQRRPAAAGGMERDLASLATYLEDLSNALEGDKQIKESLVPGRESIQVWRSIGKKDSARIGLARGLNNVAVRLISAGEPAEARKNAEEAVGIFRGFYAADPDEHREALIRCLGVLADAIDAQGRHSEASGLHQEIKQLKELEKKKEKPERPEV